MVECTPSRTPTPTPPSAADPGRQGHAERSIPLHPQAAQALQPLIDLARRQAARRRFDASAGRPVQQLGEQAESAEEPPCEP